MILSGWGRYPRLECATVTARGEAEVREAVTAHSSLIARGAGRAYGDAALNRDATLLMTGSNRMLEFDPVTGRLICEAGVMLSDIVELFMPRGWFPPVTPGTKFVTVGGMVACDVHGKNHHSQGSFGAHVEHFDLMLASGEVVCCSPNANSGLFAATLGGMGLTGVILRAAFRLRPIASPYIFQRTIRAPDLDSAMQIFEANRAWTYSVAWLDCLAKGARLGRSVIYLGEHATRDEAADRPPPSPRSRIAVPFDLPRLVLNRYSVGAHNLYRYAATRCGDSIVAAEPYFYPLDALTAWNRIYGRTGFLQHQCVLPLPVAREGLKRMLARIAARGTGSFLAVLKPMGAAGAGWLSFPMPGYTLALDFAANRANLDLLRDLDEIVADCGGRLYLAKDARADAGLVARGYPNLERFAALRNEMDPTRRFRSALSDRLNL